VGALHAPRLTAFLPLPENFNAGREWGSLQSVVTCTFLVFDQMAFY
jgi:hypothetical protein